MKNPKSYLSVENPTTTATVDFLSIGATIEAEYDKAARTITVKLKVSDGEDSSSWQEKEISLSIP